MLRVSGVLRCAARLSAALASAAAPFATTKGYLSRSLAAGRLLVSRENVARSKLFSSMDNVDLYSSSKLDT